MQELTNTNNRHFKLIGSIFIGIYCPFQSTQCCTPDCAWCRIQVNDSAPNDVYCKNHHIGSYDELKESNTQ